MRLRDRCVFVSMCLITLARCMCSEGHTISSTYDVALSCDCRCVDEVCLICWIN